MELSKLIIPSGSGPVEVNIKDATARTDIAAEYTRAIAAEQLLQALCQQFLNNDIVVVQTLPLSGTENVTYRVVGQNSYSDYMYFNNDWVLLATYSGQPDTFVHLTQQQYDALTEFEKNNGTYYFVEED